MGYSGPLVVKRLPERWNRKTWRAFITEVKRLARQSYQPQLILDLSNVTAIGQDVIDLILLCVEQIECADGRVSLAAATPETEIILELTRTTSVVDMLPSVPTLSSREYIPPISSQDSLHNLAA